MENLDARTMKTYGPELKQGILVDSGIISQSGANYLSAGIDIFQRPIALSFSSLILEQWARAMKFASINSRPVLIKNLIFIPFDGFKI